MYKCTIFYMGTENPEISFEHPDTRELQWPQVALGTKQPLHFANNLYIMPVNNNAHAIVECVPFEKG